ncbi:MAG: cytochrome c3 family protein [Coriobacteriia bacterium]|nr:cytochrome c3 family protein [Coriobacteriia bacterium]
MPGAERLDGHNESWAATGSISNGRGRWQRLGRRGQTVLVLVVVSVVAAAGVAIAFRPDPPPYANAPTSLLVNDTTSVTAGITTQTGNPREIVSQVVLSFPANTDVSAIDETSVSFTHEDAGTISFSVNRDVTSRTVTIDIDPYTVTSGSNPRAVSVTLSDLRNASVPGQYTYSVTFVSNRDTASLTSDPYALEPNQVALGVGVITLSDYVESKPSSYAVPITLGMNGRLAADAQPAGVTTPNEIYAGFPEPFALPTAPSASSVTVNGYSLDEAPTVSGQTVTIKIPAGLTIPGGDIATVVFNESFGIINPTAGTYELQASTSAEVLPGTSQSFTITGVPTILTVTSANQPAAATVGPGRSQVVDGFTLARTSGPAGIEVSSVAIENSGTAPSSTVSGVYVYRDDGDGIFGAEDTVLALAGAQFVGSTAEVSFSSPESVTDVARQYWVVYEFASTASHSATASSRVADVAHNAGGLANNAVTGSTFLVDTTPPTVTLTVVPAEPDGLAGFYVSTPLLTASTDETATVFYSFVSDGGPWTLWADPSSPVAPAEGVSTLHYYAVDAAGNASPVAARGFSVDTTAPDAPAGVSATAAGAAAIDVSWDPVPDATSGLSHYTLYRSDGATVTVTGETSHTVTGLDPDTAYGFYVTAADAAGNVSAPSATASATTGPGDTTPPTVTLTVVPAEPDGLAGFYVSTPLLTASTDETATVFYSFVSDGGPWTLWADPSSPVAPAEGVSTLHYYAEDSRGNTTGLNSQDFNVDTVSPDAPAGVTAEAYGWLSALVTWSEVVDATSGTDYYEVLVGDEVRATTAEMSTVVADLESGVVHTITVRAVDRAGWVSDLSSAVTVETEEPPSYASPPLHAVVIAPRASEVFVAWSRPSDTIGDVTYNIYRRSSEAKPLARIGSVVGIGNRSFVDMSTASSASYSYAIAVEDDRGAGPPSEISTTSVVLTPAPPALRGLTSAVTTSVPGEVRLSWTAASVPNVVGYLVFRAEASGGAVTTLTPEPVNAPSYVDDTVSPYRRYWYSVVSVDTSAAVGLPSPEVYVRAVKTPSPSSPHSLFAEPGSNRCQLCHTIHNAPGSANLLSVAGPNERALCETCHDGTGATAITADMEGPPVTLDQEPGGGTSHSLGEGGSLSCASCHDPHGPGTSSDTRRLLRAGDATGGNDFCYACHGEGSGLARGDMRPFESSGHDSGITAPSGGSETTCLACHESHGSPNESLLKYRSLNDCLRCHTPAAENDDSFDILSLLFYGPDNRVRHDVLPGDQEQNGSQMTCQNCHNAHGTAILVDPYNPSLTGTWAGSASDFCFSCHDGSLPSAQDTLPWALPPLGPGGATTTVDIKAAYLTTDPHGAAGSAEATGSARFLRSEMGFTAGSVLECATCHEPHGAANHYALRGDVTSADGTFTQRGLVVYGIADELGGGYDTRFFCAACHDMPDDAHPGPDPIPFPTDCTECHTHTAGN